MENATSPALPLLPPGSLHLDNTLGALFVGEVLISFLFGAATVQTYLYFHRNARDSLWARGTILFIWLADGLHLAFMSHGLYTYAITDFMDPLALTQCIWSLASTLFAGELTMMPVTLLFSHRIYKLSGKKWPLVFIVPSQVVSCAASIAIGIIIIKMPSYAELQAKYSWLWFVMYGLQTFTDCAIAASLCTLLFRSRSSFARTNSLISTLILFAVSTCTLTSSVSLASIIAYAAAPHNFVFLLFGMLLPKLMANSLLALLNSRGALRTRHAPGVVSVHFSQLPGALVRAGLAGSEVCVTESGKDTHMETGQTSLADLALEPKRGNIGVEAA
ncbi:hypothetical protein PsYK624_162770 [Phanerochaete sordida]|uniref:DUF6534 domain-containing protein n=1 Tax=Phanerochaete sordida TaxID=48140 RepID=A0A9P3LMT1_9APHY|nr:hypothetical protein PsYK624_162770 [Phanerochaete sordida]